MDIRVVFLFGAIINKTSINIFCTHSACVYVFITYSVHLSIYLGVKLFGGKDKCVKLHKKVPDRLPK